ncbi:MAG: LysR family transcriptional regulator [Pseudomonadota bacterium]
MIDKIDHPYQRIIAVTYEQLLVLDAIVTTGTFRAAAERLNKSQSAVSHMLKKLELEIDVELLSRDDYRPSLTPAGEVFYRQATRVLRQMRDLGTTAKQLRAQQEAEVYVAVTATSPLTGILSAVGQISAAFPATHVRFSTDAMGGPLARLLNDDADMIIATLDGVPADQVEAVPFTNITIRPVSHPNYEPGREQKVKTIVEMQSHVQVVVADNSGGAFPQSRGLLPGGLRWTVSDFATKKEVLLAGLGWGGLPEHLIECELKSGQLVPLDVEGYPPMHSQLYKIRRRDRDIGIVAGAIWDRLSA